MWLCFSVQNTGEESPKGPTPLGMESGVITDSQISASSVYSNKHVPQNARLHFKGAKAPLAFVPAGWRAGVRNTNQWLQVDLQQTTRIIGIATQGRHDFDQWITKYKLQYSKLTVSTDETVTHQKRYEYEWLSEQVVFFFLLRGWDNEKQLRVPMSYRTSEIRILRFNALTLRHSDFTGSWAMTRFSWAITRCIICSNMSFPLFASCEVEILENARDRVVEFSEIKLY